MAADWASVELPGWETSALKRPQKSRKAFSISYSANNKAIFPETEFSESGRLGSWSGTTPDFDSLTLFLTLFIKNQIIV